jgi:hypothetical protein
LSWYWAQHTVMPRTVKTAGSIKTCLHYYVRNWNTELLTEPRPKRTTAETFGVDVWKWRNEWS